MFDIDNTLLNPNSGPDHDQPFKNSIAAVKKCLDHGMALAINTAEPAGCQNFSKRQNIIKMGIVIPDDVYLC